jgi:hypothetical protein
VKIRFTVKTKIELVNHRQICFCLDSWWRFNIFANYVLNLDFVLQKSQLLINEFHQKSSTEYENRLQFLMKTISILNRNASMIKFLMKYDTKLESDARNFNYIILRLEMYFMMFPFLRLHFQFRPMNMFNRIIFGALSFEAEFIPKYNW